jgi:hypothetical protein
MPLLTFLQEAIKKLNLRVTQKTTTLVYLAWDKVAGAEGYLFFRNGQRVSRTFNPDLTSTHFLYKKGDVLSVQAVKFAIIEEDKITV